MLISARDVSPAYKAREKKETLRMEAALKAANDATPGETFATTIFTRPANPMRSKASWFLHLAYLKGTGMTDNGLSIRIAMAEAEKLCDISDHIWNTASDPALLLFASSDGSIVVGVDDPETDDILLLPLVVQLRGTLKNKAGTSIKQVYRTGDGWSKPQGVYLTPKGGVSMNVIRDTSKSPSLADTWDSQVETEVKALFDYQSKHPLHLDTQTAHQDQDVPTAFGMSIHITDREMALLCRQEVHDCHLHLGTRSFTDDEQKLLTEALGLAVAGWMPDGDMSAFEGYKISLIAGNSYDGSNPHIEATPDHIGSVTVGSAARGAAKEVRAKLLAPIEKSLGPILAALDPHAMMHDREDIKASWTIAQIRPVATSAHQKIEARRDFVEMMKEAKSR